MGDSRPSDDSPRTQASSGPAPTTLDVSRLHRQPGSMLEIEREIPAPADLAVAMARVPESSPIELDLTLESVVEGIWVSGTADVEVTAECSRCLEPVEWAETVDLEQMYRYPATDARGVHIDEADDSEDETPEVVDDAIDIEGPLRDAVVLALPIAPLCSPDCRGICPTCGERLSEGEAPHDHPVTDPRWSALEGLLDDEARE
jgi:uncharacterized protein